jgi:uncharacterized protein (DUF3084 family)
MELPTTLTDALAALSAAQADVAALNALSAEHTALVAQFDALKASNVDLAAAVQALSSEKMELAKALDAAKLAEAEASAKANTIVANLGVAPVAIQSEQTTATKTVVELWAEYNSLPLEARNEFYTQHKAALKLS